MSQIPNTLKDIANESEVTHAEACALRSISKYVRQLETEVSHLKEGLNALRFEIDFDGVHEPEVCGHKVDDPCPICMIDEILQ